MNLRGGWALIRGTWLSWMQHRAFFFILAFGWMVPPLVSLLVWSAAAGQDSLGGYDRGGFVAYYLVLIFVNQFTYAQANWTLGDVIRMGGLNTWLLQPLPAVYQVLSSEAAGKTVTLAFVLPVAGALALILRPELQVSGSALLLFLLSLALAWLLRFMWGYWLALLAFWYTRADALLAVQDALVFLLSGVVAPVTLLPAFLQGAARLLPFRYMVGFPVEVLLGGLPAAEVTFGLAVQAGWAALAVMLAALMWRAGIKRYSAVGG